jgi:hypothetical protein
VARIFPAGKYTLYEISCSLRITITGAENWISSSSSSFYESAVKVASESLKSSLDDGLRASTKTGFLYYVTRQRGVYELCDVLLFVADFSISGE